MCRFIFYDCIPLHLWGRTAYFNDVVKQSLKALRNIMININWLEEFLKEEYSIMGISCKRNRLIFLDTLVENF